MNFGDPPPMPEQFNHWVYELTNEECRIAEGHAMTYRTGLCP